MAHIIPIEFKGKAKRESGRTFHEETKNSIPNGFFIS